MKKKMRLGAFPDGKPRHSHQAGTLGELVGATTSRDCYGNAAGVDPRGGDGGGRRGFSNPVTEFTTEYDPGHPPGIAGGQHRYEEIEEALASEVDEYHGVKVYFGLCGLTAPACAPLC
jgi:hypothetical protein